MSHFDLRFCHDRPQDTFTLTFFFRLRTELLLLLHCLQPRPGSPRNWSPWVFSFLLLLHGGDLLLDVCHCLLHGSNLLLEFCHWLMRLHHLLLRFWFVIFSDLILVFNRLLHGFLEQFDFAFPPLFDLFLVKLLDQVHVSVFKSVTGDLPSDPVKNVVGKERDL